MKLAIVLYLNKCTTKTNIVLYMKMLWFKVTSIFGLQFFKPVYSYFLLFSLSRIQYQNPTQREIKNFIPNINLNHMYIYKCHKIHSMQNWDFIEIFDKVY